jgi:hypothetical protein
MLDKLKGNDAPPISPGITFTGFIEGIRKWHIKISIEPPSRPLNEHSTDPRADAIMDAPSEAAIAVYFDDTVSLEYSVCTVYALMKTNQL